MKNIRYILSLSVLLFIIVSGCGTGSGGDKAPSLPKLEKGQPDVSYFETSSKSTSTAETATNFAEAQGIVLGFSSISSITQIYSGFMQGAESSSASTNNGVFEWTYTSSYLGSTAEIRLTAEPTNGSTTWNLFMSISTTQVSFTDYNVLSGTTKNDGDEGTITFNSLSTDGTSEIPALQSDWLFEAENDQSITLTIYDSSGNKSAALNYDLTNAEHKLFVDFVDGSPMGSGDVTVFWDTESNIGYVDDSNGRRCWQGRGSSATDVSCATVGL